MINDDVLYMVRRAGIFRMFAGLLAGGLNSTMVRVFTLKTDKCYTSGSPSLTSRRAGSLIFANNPLVTSILKRNNRRKHNRKYQKALHIMMIKIVL